MLASWHRLHSGSEPPYVFMPPHCLPSPALLPMVSPVSSIMREAWFSSWAGCADTHFAPAFSTALLSVYKGQGCLRVFHSHWPQVLPSAAALDEAPQAVLSKPKIHFLVLSEPNMLKLGTCSYFGKARLAGPYRMLSGGA